MTQDLLNAVKNTIGDRKLLLATYHGSKLYGTSGADSDVDIRVVFAPTQEEILLGKTDFSIDNNPDSAQLGLGDIDVAGFSFARFIRLMAKFDVNSVEMLFASKSNSDALIYVDPDFKDTQDNFKSLIATGGSSPIGHARAIAGPYAPDADSYMAAFEFGLSTLNSALENGAEETDKLFEVEGLLQTLRQMEDAKYLAKDQQGKDVLEADIPEEVIQAGRWKSHTLFVTVADRKIGSTNSIRSIIDVLEKPLKRMRQETIARRARMEGTTISPKDLYHAVRILTQYVEIFETDELVFPRPNADTLRKIRNEELPGKELEAIITKAFEDAVEAKKEGLTYSETPDDDVQKATIIKLHKAIVLGD